ncbi:MAG: hypothetical protein AABX31_01390 [Nanoarchaeota archaeon]|mgnify:FL=1
MSLRLEKRLILVLGGNKMILYQLDNREEDRTNIYARNSQHIVELVELYAKRLTPEERNHPKLMSWLKPNTISKIIEVDSGVLRFQAGMINTALEGNLFEELPVTSDFKVQVNLESLPYFDTMRAGLLKEENKRGQLYKFHNNHGLFASQNYLPQDIAEAVVKYDLKSLYEKAEETLERITSLKHPSLYVGIKRR